MKQTPVHDQYNPDLLRLMPTGLRCVVEVGCSSGALARAYQAANPDCEYIGLEIDQDYAKMAAAHCSKVLIASIESLDESQLRGLSAAECWIFGDVLEHLHDPWGVLRRIRGHLPANGQVIACIPNAQHWSVQARLNCGKFVYEEMGLMDRTHIRWFTRLTIMEMFQSAGYRITEGFPRVLPGEPGPSLQAAIKAMAAAVGEDADMALQDALPFQWVIKAVPA